ncbi:MAG TPA: ABC transporter permease [Terriglobales bacterium]|nr:ABC transporter permease [Terriglobales bacterium]
MRLRRHKELNEELAAHLEQRAATLEARGLSADEARRQARIEFGSVDKYAEQTRETSGLAGIEHAVQDARFGLRLLRKSPGFTVVATLLLALGIGANAAVFSMVDWILLRPLPVPHASQLSYVVAANTQGGFSNGFSYPNFSDIRAQSGAVFSDLAGLQPFEMDGIRTGGTTTSIWVNYVSGNFFSMLELKPALGRFFSSPPDKEEQAPPELVLSYSYWLSRFGGRPDVVGQQAIVNGKPVTIVGVAPKGFNGVLAVLNTQGYLPFTRDLAGELGGSGDLFHDRANNAGVLLVGRRRAGVSLAGTEPLLKVIGLRIAAAHPKAAPWRDLRAVQLTSAPPGASAQVNNPLPAVAALFLTLAGLVLLLACVNIASLLLARAGVRRREIAVRAALGAGRWRLLRQMMIESLLLGLLGGAGGVAVAEAACAALNAMPLGSGVPIVLSFGVSWHVVLYACLAAVGTGIAVGIMPAWQASRLPPITALQAGSHGMASRTRLRSFLVAAEIAGSLMLMIVAGLFVRSLGQVQHVDLGFDANGVLNLTLDPHAAGYNAERGENFATALLARVRSLPGAADASVAAALPMGDYNYASNITMAGHTSTAGHETSVGYNAVSSDYLATMGIRLVRGRAIMPGDSAGGPRVAVINQKMAETFWPGGDALGQVFQLNDDPRTPVTVVGIAANSVTDSITDPVTPYMYLPFAQHYHSPVVVQIRARDGTDPAALLRDARAQVETLEPGMLIVSMETMRQALYSLGLFIYELGATLAAILGLLGLFMALIGVYGVVAYNASQRAHEIGVRVALGARRGQILSMVLRQGIWITAAGLGIGLALAAALAQGLRGFLFGVSVLDPLTFGAATAILAAVALAASVIPASKATRSDPVKALRCE